MKRLIICCLIAIAGGAALAWRNPPAMAFLSPFVPAPISGAPSSACPATPSMAVAASFTTCIANFDWTVSTGTTWLPSAYAFPGSMGTTANWLDCTRTDSTKSWHWFGGAQTNGACTNASITTDGGSQVLDLHMPAVASGANHSEIMANSEGYSGPVTPGFPTGMLWEVTTRIGALYGGGGAEGGVFSWQVAPALAFNDEIYTNNYSAVDSGAFGTLVQPSITYWDNINFASNCLNSPCNKNVPGGSGFNNSSAYHVYDLLETTDGSTQVYGCAWVDGVFQSCDNGNIVSGNAGAINHNTWFFLGPQWKGSAPWPAMDFYYKKVNVWACSGWQTSSCPGSILVNGPSPGLTYYHN